MTMPDIIRVCSMNSRNIMPQPIPSHPIPSRPKSNQIKSNEITASIISIRFGEVNF